MRIDDSATSDRYYQALLDRDPAYLGIFYVGVTTTTVFCIATCRARKPKRENVVFYSQIKDALDAGFRPCKICRPTEHAHSAPPQVEAALQLLRDQTKQKVGDAQLRQHGISPETVRRWFQQHYGMTFQAYQRMLRINQAVIELKQGRSATDTALDAGYDSLSGFGYTCKKLLGHAPEQSRTRDVILIQRLTTPLGPMFVCATELGICLLEFVDRRMLETEFSDLQHRLQAPIVAGENRHIKQLKHELAQYFAGQRQVFTVALHSPGTPFQQAVWDCLKMIPCGHTASYQQQAERLGQPTAVRAVAAANGANRLSILIPCHRVIGKDGSLTGYGGGLPRKRWLLDHEKAMLEAAKA